MRIVSKKKKLFYKNLIIKMAMQLEKICRTCMTESSTLISIWSLDKTSTKDSRSLLEPPSLALMLNVITSCTVNLDVVLYLYVYTFISLII